MKRIAIVREVDNIVVGMWSGGAEQTLAPIASYVYVTLPADDTTDYTGHHWLGDTSFEPVAVPVRVLSRREFRRRFTFNEEVAIETLAETDAQLRVLMRRLSEDDTVNLDHAELIAGLALLKAKGIWPDVPTADSRIAEIRA